MATPVTPTAPRQNDALADQPYYRSGAVARMAQMPVATLRVWERRYAVTRPTLSQSGQRLYTEDDVRRLALLKQLTDLGHAIGSIALLDMAQLQAVQGIHHQVGAARLTLPTLDQAGPALPRGLRIAVVGAGLAARLRRPALLRRLGPLATVVGPFADLSEVAAALQVQPVDALLWHAPTLHKGWRSEIESAAPALQALPKAVFYGYAAEAVCEAVVAAGIQLLREPQPDSVLAQWLQNLVAGLTPRSPNLRIPAPLEAVPVVALTPPRWSDAVVAGFAALASSVACECPRHVAELLQQLVRFEAYSAECAQRDLEDAALHAYLQHLAGTSRVQFEAALQHIAQYEGLTIAS